MKKNFGDEILTGLDSLIEEASDYMAAEYRSVKPFDKQPVSMAEQLYEYDRMKQNPMLMIEKIQKEGFDKVNKWIYDLEQYRSRRLKNA